MQDVVPPAQERSIRNIPVPAGRRHFTPAEGGTTGGSRRRGGSLWLWAVAAIVGCGILGVFAAGFFSGASVTVHPRQAQVSVPSSILASIDAPVGSLPYKLMTVSKTSTRTAPASGTAQVSNSAQGTITIYNNYDTAPQKLITNTRFSTPDGKIYRIHQAVTVPGAKKAADGTLTPGSVTATAYADKPGADYNIGQTRFTIPGFKGDPRYDKFYAETDGMQGGFVGTQPSVSASDLAKAKTDMQNELSGSLSSDATAQIPTGYIAVPGTLSVEYGTVQSTDAGGGNATMTLDATATQAIIKSSDLANAVASLEVANYDGAAVDFANPSDLTLGIASSTPYNPAAKSFALSLSGNPTLVWQFDPAAVQQALAGKTRGEFEAIIKNFAPAIAEASASLQPFWQQTFPADPNKIKIKVDTSS